jgi:hypothetical protein
MCSNLHPCNINSLTHTSYDRYTMKGRGTSKEYMQLKPCAEEMSREVITVKWYNWQIMLQSFIQSTGQVQTQFRNMGKISRSVLFHVINFAYNKINERTLFKLSTRDFVQNSHIQKWNTSTWLAVMLEGEENFIYSNWLTEESLMKNAAAVKQWKAWELLKTVGNNSKDI